MYMYTYLLPIATKILIQNPELHWPTCSDWHKNDKLRCDQCRDPEVSERMSVFLRGCYKHKLIRYWLFPRGLSRCVYCVSKRPKWGPNRTGSISNLLHRLGLSTILHTTSWQTLWARLSSPSSCSRWPAPASTRSRLCLVTPVRRSAFSPTKMGKTAVEQRRGLFRWSSRIRTYRFAAYAASKAALNQALRVRFLSSQLRKVVLIASC